MGRKYVGTNVEIDTTPGTFVYEGFGTGTLYLKDGETKSTHRQEARELCKEHGLEFRYTDSFDYYKPVYLGD
jgi:hypothetical protein